MALDQRLQTLDTSGACEEGVVTGLPCICVPPEQLALENNGSQESGGGDHSAAARGEHSHFHFCGGQVIRRHARGRARVFSTVFSRTALR